jgi:hypothetical protein
MANRFGEATGTSTGTATGPGNVPATRVTAGLNQPVRDGRFEFTITNVACGKATEQNGSLRKTAQGQYCEVALTVKNIGAVPGTFDGTSQKAKGPAGATYDNDGVAELYANSGNQTFLDDINPGNAVRGVLVFDIPKNARILDVELHESTLSDGVTVAVT